MGSGDLVLPPCRQLAEEEATAEEEAAAAVEETASEATTGVKEEDWPTKASWRI